MNREASKPIKTVISMDKILSQLKLNDYTASNDSGRNGRCTASDQQDGKGKEFINL